MVSFYCPGCNFPHRVDPKKWTVDLQHDTIRPSVLVRGVNRPDELETDENGDYIFENGVEKGSHPIRCHSFVRNGEIQYLNDCTHQLAGQVVNMEEI